MGTILWGVLLVWISHFLLGPVCARVECQGGREHALKVCDVFVEGLSVVRGRGGKMDGEGETTAAGASEPRIGGFFSLLFCLLLKSYGCIGGDTPIRNHFMSFRNPGS